MPLKLKWPYKYRLLKVASDGKFGRLGPFDYYLLKGKKIKLPHQGSDYRLPCGTPFYSPVKGKVDILEKNDFGYGYFVRIKFGIRHIGFAHNSRLDIKLGQTIKVGQLLGLTGSTGRGKSCHSHVELRVHDKVVNPETMIQWIVENKMADAKTIYRNIFITIFKRWPTQYELKSFVDSKNTPYTYAQKHLIPKRYISKSTYDDVNSQLKTIKGQLKTLQKDHKRTLATMNKQSLLIDDQMNEVAKLNEKLRVLNEKLKSCQHGSQKREEVKTMEIFSKVPGKGSRTVLAILLLVLVTIAKEAGVGEDSLSSELVSSVQVVLAGLTGIFFRLK